MSDLLAANPLVQAIGYALVAFLWQGAAIGAAAFASAAAFRRATPQTKYLVGCLSLATLMVTPVVTAARRLHDAPGSAPRATAASSVASAPGELRASVDASADLAEGPGSSSRTRMPIVVIAWGIGVAVFGLHLLRGGVIVRRIRRAAAPLVDPDRIDALRRIADRMRLTRSVVLLESAMTEVPAVIGWLRPAIVLPVSSLAGLAPSHFEAILAHELAHIRRGDYLVNVIQRIVETLLFYHPAVWWVSAWIRREREHCCDDVAAAVCGDRIRYAHALRALEELRHVPMSLAMGARSGDLVSRVRRLVKGTPDPLPNWSGGVVMIVPILALLTFGSHTSGPRTAVPTAVSSPDAVRVEATLPAPNPTAAATPSDMPHIAAPLAADARAAQVAIGVTGIVTDPSGGRLPGANVTLRSQAGEQLASAYTNASGSFSLSVSNVAAGDYDVAVTLPGFKTTHDAVRIGAGEPSSLMVRMQLGSIAEEVNVIAPAMPVLPTDVLPAALQTAADYRAAAYFYYVREAFSDAEAMIDRANEMTSPAVATPEVMSAPGVVRVGGSVKEPRKVRDVKPIFPAMAVAAGMEGVVTIRAIVTRNGTVGDAVITSGGSVFDTAALDAVRQWLFTPTELNAVPVEVLMDVTISFKKR